MAELFARSLLQVDSHFLQKNCQPTALILKLRTLWLLQLHLQLNRFGATGVECAADENNMYISRVSDDEYFAIKARKIVSGTNTSPPIWTLGQDWIRGPGIDHVHQQLANSYTKTTRT